MSGRVVPTLFWFLSLPRPASFASSEVDVETQASGPAGIPTAAAAVMAVYHTKHMEVSAVSPPTISM